MDFQQLKYKLTVTIDKTKLWYIHLDGKKKIVIWLYFICALILLIGSASIIIGSVFQTEKFDNKAKLDAYIAKTEELNEKYEQISDENDLEAVEDRTKLIETDFRDATKDLELNTDLIENLLNPISAPLSD
jgi:hypothetical protein